MHRSHGWLSIPVTRLLATLAVFALCIAGFVVTSAVAEDGTMTLRGDPTGEAAEREKLFAALAAASNVSEAQALSAQIWSLWFRAPDEAAATLMHNALQYRSTHDYLAAVKVLDGLVESAPDWAEAWNQRATMRYLLRDFDGSLADVDRVLELEPKHFGALSGQALILMQQGKMPEGQIALRKALEVHPFLRERALLVEPEGQDI